MLKRTAICGGLVMWSTMAQADFIVIDAKLDEVRTGFVRCMTVEDVSACVSQLQGHAEDPSGTDESQRFAIDALTIVDSQESQLDLREYFDALAESQAVRAAARSSARMARLRAEVLAIEVAEKRRVALLGGIVEGRTPFGGLGFGERRWAAVELCARGTLNADIRDVIEQGYGASAAGVLADCERQVELLRSGLPTSSIEAAVSLRDWSWSKAFHRAVVTRALSSKDDRVQRQVVREVGQMLSEGTAADVDAAETVLRQLATMGWSVERMEKAGLGGRARALSRSIVNGANRQRQP